MRNRSYAFYEIRRRLGRDDEELVYRTDLESDAFRRFSVLSEDVNKGGANLYLVKVQLLKAAKGDKQ